MSNGPARNGTTVRVHGVACANRECDHYQHIFAFGFKCAYCGHELRLGSAAVASFEWSTPKLQQEPS